MKLPRKSDVFKAILREDLCAFVEKSFRTISPEEPFIRNWHIEAIAHRLAKCLIGETRRLVITQPPRSLKSIASSVAFVAWALGRDPTLRFICVSYSQDLALELARQFRLVVSSDWYQAAFPAMRLAKDSGAECVTTMGGGRLATSIGGTLTGRGADIILIDDPMKAEDAVSDLARGKVIHWFSSTLSTRLNDKRDGSIILVMQRLHELDLAGHVLDTGEWEHLDLPAIALTDERIEISPGVVHQRRAGEALQPLREPIETLDKLRAEIGTLRFSSQYQQRPIPVDGALIKRAWFGVFDTPPKGEIVQSWDCASSVRGGADYSACITAVYRAGKHYIVDVWRGRVSYPDLKRKIVELAVRHRATTIYIESAGPGFHLLQELKSRRGCHADFIGIRPVDDKLVRLEGVSARIENGGVLLPKSSPWLDAFLAEIIAFPHGRHDDQADALSQLLARPRPQSSGLAAPILIRRQRSVY